MTKFIISITGGMLTWDEKSQYRCTSITVFSTTIQEAYEATKSWCKLNFKDWTNIQQIPAAENSMSNISISPIANKVHNGKAVHITYNHRIL